jgi:hypothetical protein
VTIRGGTVEVTKGIASPRVSCPAASPGDCTGRLTVRTANRVRLARVSVVLRLGSARYNLAPGATKTLEVKLPNGIKCLADRKGHLKVLVVASTGRAGKIASSSQRATRVVGKAKRH